MNFALLTENELDEFLTRDYSEYDIFIDSDLTRVEQAESLFDQLNIYFDVEYPLPVVDLYLASQYQGPLDQRYTLDQLFDLTQDQIDDFVELFNLNPPIYIERIIRILSYLDLVIDSRSISLNMGVTDAICSQLPLKDLSNLMESLEELNSTDDPDRQISQVLWETIQYLNQFGSHVSKRTVRSLIESDFPSQLEYLSDRLKMILEWTLGPTKLLWWTMWENLIVSMSNLVGLNVLSNDISDMGRLIVRMSIFSSILYHLFEHQKHGMPGVSRFPSLKFLSDPMAHQIFINIDRFSAVLATYWFFDPIFLNDPAFTTIGLTGLASLFFSEVIFKHPKYKSYYIITHSLWHIAAFICLYIITA